MTSRARRTKKRQMVIIGRRMRPALALALVLLGIAGLVGGCGKPVSREDYTEAMAAPLGQVDLALRALESAPSTELVASAAETQAGLLAAADAMESIEPPERLFEAHRLLVEGFRDLAGEVTEIARLGLSTETPDILAAIEDLPALAKIQQAQELFSREDVTLSVGPPPASG